MKISKEMLLTVGGASLLLIGNVIKGIGDKKTSDNKLEELVNKAVEEKLNNQ